MPACLPGEAWSMMVTAIAILLLLSSPPLDAKGTLGGGGGSSRYGTHGSGYSGAGYGGRVSGYARGPYAPYSRYYIFPYGYYGYGYYGYYPHCYYCYRGQTAEDLEALLEDVTCSRLVNVSQTADLSVFESRRYCYHEVYGQPGSPENAIFDDIGVDVMRWNITFLPGQYPTINFSYYLDATSLASPQFTYLLTLKRVRLYPQGQDIDLRDFFQGHAPFGYPLSFVSMGDRITVVRMVAQDSTSTLQLSFSFQLADNFEDINHEFYRPSALKVFMTVGGLTTPGTFVLDAEITPMEQRGMMTSFSSTAYGAHYDPKEQDRIVLGQLPDEEFLQRGYISLGKSTAPNVLCFQGTESHCTTTSLVNVTSASVFFNVSGGHDGTPLPPRLQLNVGFYDPLENPPAGATVRCSPQWIVLLAVLSANFLHTSG